MTDREANVAEGVVSGREDISTELVPLAREITQAHEEACHAAQSALEHARRAGELLIQAKKGIAHGAWQPWLAAQCPTIRERTAQAYMRVARRWPELEAKTQRVADLPLRGALALLAEPGDAEHAADTEEEVPLGANPTEHEFLTWLGQIDRRHAASERAWQNDLEAQQNRPTPDDVEGWREYLRAGRELLERAIRLKLEVQRDFVGVCDALSSFDADVPPLAAERAKIEGDTARLTTWLADLDVAGVA